MDFLLVKLGRGRACKGEKAEEDFFSQAQAHRQRRAATRRPVPGFGVQMCFLLTAAKVGLVPGEPTVRASGRLHGNEVPAFERSAQPAPEFTTVRAQQTGLLGLVFSDNRGCRFLGCHSHGFGLLGLYNCFGK